MRTVVLRAGKVCRMDHVKRGTDAHYAALGRVQTALFDSGDPGVMEGAQYFHHQENVQHGFSLFWERGPHASEVVQELLDLAADGERTSVLQPRDVVFVHNDEADPTRHTTVDVCGVRFLLHPCDTIGRDAAFTEALAGLRRG